MKLSMVNSNTTSVLVLLLAGILLFVTTTNAAPHFNRFSYPNYPVYFSPLSFEGQNPEGLIQTIYRLKEALVNDNDLENVSKRSPNPSQGDDMPVWEKYYENQREQKKRKTDFGTDRGYSGQQEHNIRLNNTKRGIDLGLSRGFSGSQAAKHLMGLAAANFAGGPGRRRRNDDEDA